MKIMEVIKEQKLIDISDLYSLKSRYNFDYNQEITRTTVEDLNGLRMLIIKSEEMNCKYLSVVNYLIDVIENKITSDFISFQEVYNEFKNKNNLREDEKVNFKEFNRYLIDTNRKIEMYDFINVMSQVGKQSIKRGEMR